VTSMKDWEKKVLNSPGAPERVAQIEHELRLAAGLTNLREQAGLSQRELADRLGVRQPRVAAIERSHNVTFDVLERYVAALGGHIEVSVVREGKTTPLISGRVDRPAAQAATKPARKAATKKASAARKSNTPTPRTRAAKNRQTNKG